MSNYTAKNIRTLKDIEGIRMRPAMYIGDSGSTGMHHLLQEIISNSIDEFLNGYGKEIKVTVYTDENEIIIEDGGRGIPFGLNADGDEALEVVATKLHSGGKFNERGEEGGYNVSGGLHGIGLTATNALSIFMKLQSTRDGQRKTLTFERGVLDSSNQTTAKTKPSGTLIQFKPDPIIFGDNKWDIKLIKEVLQNMSYLTSHLTFTLNVDGETTTFYSEEGIKDLLQDNVTEESVTDTHYFTASDTRSGNSVEVAFTYAKENFPLRVMSFTNNIYNAEGGTHVTGFKTALTSVLNKMAKEHKMLPAGVEALRGELLHKGMSAVVSFKMEETPQFKSQTKEKLQSSVARTAVNSFTSDYLIRNMSQKDLKIIIDRAILEQKAIDAAKRVRETESKIKTGGTRLNRLELAPKLRDCRDRDKGELFLVEGDSASGTAKQGSNSQFQAIMPLRGKVLNTQGKTINEAIRNQEVKHILNVLGCGVGENFNINNLRYDKIVLLADADPDGQHINVLLMTLFLTFLPQLITEGKLYRACPPLFKVTRGKSSYYVYTNEELREDIEKFGNPSDIQRYKGLGEMSAGQLRETVFDPENRMLIPLTTEDLKETSKLFNTIMGKDSSSKYNFIVANSDILNET